MAEILVIDDSKQFLRETRFAISRRGYSVATAEDGEVGLQIFKSDPEIKLVVADIHMPKVDGLEVAVAIRDSDRNVPVIALTTERGSELILQGNLARIRNWIIKPCNPDNLVAGINKLLAKG